MISTLDSRAECADPGSVANKPNTRDFSSTYSEEQRQFQKHTSCDACQRGKGCDRNESCTSCIHRCCNELCNCGPKPFDLTAYSSPKLSTGDHDDECISTRSSSTDEGWTTAEQKAALSLYPCTNTRWGTILQRSVDQINHSKQYASFREAEDPSLPFPPGSQVSTQAILDMLPPIHCCAYLVTLYFGRVSPSFHILHGPTFQNQFYKFLGAPTKVDLSWLALLFAMCSVAVHTLEDDDPILAEMWPRTPQAQKNDIAYSSYRLRAAAKACLCQDGFLWQHRLSTLEALLVLIYTISHYEGVERGWTLLGIASNIGIALKCNVLDDSVGFKAGLDCIEMERRRRCWAGVLMLHTYQAISYQDIDMSFLLNLPAQMPADVNDCDVSEMMIRPPSTQPTQMSVMMFKIRLFQLSGRVLSQISGTLDEATLIALDEEVAAEQEQWSSTFLSDGSPSILDAPSYAHWCILQLYAHQLYLLLHRSFCHSRNAFHFRPASLTRCLTSGAALLDLHGKLLELPRLRQYRWYVFGMTSLAAVHGAVALASCLLEVTDSNDSSSNYHSIFDAAVLRIQSLQDKSPICLKSMPILLHLLTRLSVGRTQLRELENQEFGPIFDDWIDRVQWLNPELVDWDFWNDKLQSEKK